MTQPNSWMRHWKIVSVSGQRCSAHKWFTVYEGTPGVPTCQHCKNCGAVRIRRTTAAAQGEGK